MKINISIEKEVLEELDTAARNENTSRSAFMTEAVRHFLEEKKEVKRKERRRQAAKDIDRIREQAEPWDASGEIIGWREKH